MQARAHAKYKILMEAAPDATIDCGDLLQPQRLFDVLDCAAAKLAGLAEFIFENFACCDAQCSARLVHFIPSRIRQPTITHPHVL
jgi:hypothetical protein